MKTRLGDEKTEKSLLNLILASLFPGTPQICKLNSSLRGKKHNSLWVSFQTIDSVVVRDNLRVLVKQFYGLTIALDEVWMSCKLLPPFYRSDLRSLH